MYFYCFRVSWARSRCKFSTIHKYKTPSATPTFTYLSYKCVVFHEMIPMKTELDDIILINKNK